MRDHPSAGPAQGHCTEVMIGVVVRQDQPADGLAGDRMDRAHQPLPLRGAGERIKCMISAPSSLSVRSLIMLWTGSR